MHFPSLSSLRELPRDIIDNEILHTLVQPIILFAETHRNTSVSHGIPRLPQLTD